MRPTYWYILIHIDTYWYLLIHIDTYWYILIRIDTYWYVLILIDTYTSWQTVFHVPEPQVPQPPGDESVKARCLPEWSLDPKDLWFSLFMGKTKGKWWFSWDFVVVLWDCMVVEQKKYGPIQWWMEGTIKGANLGYSHSQQIFLNGEPATELRMEFPNHPVD